MRRLLLFLALLPAFCWAQLDYHIIPQPKFLDYGQGSYELPQGWTARQARHQKDPSLGKEAYALSISEKGVTISASTEQGFFYGEQTLAQMISQSDGKSLRCLTVSDEPRFDYRGLMLDVVRCFIPKDEILRVIDVASQLKINNLHLHLTDDNGWRVEIRKYPKLTQTGAWRVARDTPFPNRENPREGEPTPVGGYYTQKELRDIVAYAKRRHVNVVPEIEMPAHSVAAIASYPEMTCPWLAIASSVCCPASAARMPASFIAPATSGSIVSCKTSSTRSSASSRRNTSTSEATRPRSRTGGHAVSAKA